MPAGGWPEPPPPPEPPKSTPPPGPLYALRFAGVAPFLILVVAALYRFAG